MPSKFISYLLLSSLQASTALAITNHKDAAQFCIPHLSAEEQRQYYSRILTLGASFTHGCIWCENISYNRESVEMSNDDNWIRRNYFLRVLQKAPWKDKDEFAFDKVYVLENEIRGRLGMLMPEKQLKREGYTGEWVYWPKLDRVTLLDEKSAKEIKAQPSFVDYSNLIGGIRRSYDTKPGTGMYGHIFETVPGSSAPSGAKPKLIFDASLDSARNLDLFRNNGNDELFNKLMSTGWKDPQMRKRVRQSAAESLARFRPSISVAVDSMFWDAFWEALYRSHEARPLSPTMIFVGAFFQLSPQDKYLYRDSQARKNIREDFMLTLEELASGEHGNDPSPLIIARLIDDPARKIKERDLALAAGVIVGKFAEQFTGKDFSESILPWLREISYSYNPHGQVLPFEDNYQQKSTRVVQRIPRHGKYKDKRTGMEFNEGQVADIRTTYETLEKEIPAHLGRFGLNEKWFSEVGTFSHDPFRHSSVPDVKKRVMPQYVRGIINGAILYGLKEIPTIVENLNAAFNETNAVVRQFATKPDNRIYMANADSFFLNFPSFLLPATMHPSVYGAENIASIFIDKMCMGADN